MLLVSFVRDVRLREDLTGHTITPTESMYRTLSQQEERSAVAVSYTVMTMFVLLLHITAVALMCAQRSVKR